MPFELIKTIHNLFTNADPLVDNDLITVSASGSTEINKVTFISLASHIVNYSTGRLGIFNIFRSESHVANMHATPKVVVGMREGNDISTSLGGPYLPQQLYGQLSSDAEAFPSFVLPWAPWWIPFNHIDFGGEFFTAMPGWDTLAFTPPLTTSAITESSFSMYALEICLTSHAFNTGYLISFRTEIGFIYYEGDPPVQQNVFWIHYNEWEGLHFYQAYDNRIIINGTMPVVVPNNLTVKRWYTPCYAWNVPILGLYFERLHSSFKVVRLK